jgi:hypothetical protein
MFLNLFMSILLDGFTPKDNEGIPGEDVQPVDQDYEYEDDSQDPKYID